MKTKSVGTTIIKAVLSLIILFIMFWFELPSINPLSEYFWSFVSQAIVV